MSACRRFLWLLLVCGWLIPRASADDAQPDHDPIGLRRIFVPADRAAQWLRSDYVPIEAARLSELLQTADSGAATVQHVRGASVQAATYRARLQGDDLLDGTAQLQISHRGDSATMLPLAPCDLAISAAQWNGSQEPAVLGLTDAGQPAIEVKQSGSLQLEWSKSGGASEGEPAEFRLRLPRAARCEMVLDLPEQVEPRVDTGIVRRRNDASGGRCNWHLQLPSQREILLRLQPTAGDGRQPVPLVQQLNVYQLGPQLQMRSRLTIGQQRRPTDRLAVLLDEPLRLVSARYQDTPLVVAGVEKTDTGAAKVLLDLPTTMRRGSVAFELTAVMTLPESPLWRLPRIRIAGADWMQETSRLVVPRPMVLHRLELDGCRQVNVETRSDPNPAAVIEVAHFAAEASIEVGVGQQRNRLVATSATIVRVEPSELSATTNVRVASRQGSSFTLAAEVEQDWIVDDVRLMQPESDDSPRVKDWMVLRGKSPASRLQIVLDRAIEPGRDLRLQVIGRRRRNVREGPIRLTETQMVRFAEIDSKLRLVLLQPRRGFQLSFPRSPAIQTVDSAELDPADAELLGDDQSGTLLRYDPPSGDVSFTMRPQSPEMSAEIVVDVSLADDRVVESYRLACDPQAVATDRLLVQLFTSRDAPLKWTDEAGEPLTAELADMPPAPNQQGEIWRVQLGRPRSEPFVLRATRTSDLTDSWAPSLASVVDARRQTGRLVIRAAGHRQLRFDQRELEPIPIADAMDELAAPRVCGHFRYEPQQHVVAETQPALSLKRKDRPQGEAAAWVWKQRLDSSLGHGTTSVHRDTFYLENQGKRRLSLRLPHGAELLRIWLNDRRLPISFRKGSQVDLSISPGDRFPCLAVEYSTSRQPLWLVQRFERPAATLDVPTLSRQWRIWLAPGLELVGTSVADDDGFGWVRRLFGPLARTGSPQPFRPLNRDDWREMLRLDWLGSDDTQRARQVLNRLAEATEPIGPGESISLGSLLQRYNQPEGGRGATAALFADGLSLQRAGISAESRLTVPAAADAAGRVEKMLKQAGLGVLVDLEKTRLIALRDVGTDGALVRVSPAPIYAFGSCIDRDLGNRQPTGLPAAVWARLPVATKVPWRDESGAAYSGWTSLRVQGASDQGHADVVWRSRMQIAATISFLLASVVASWLVQRRTRSLLILAAFVAGAALLVPAASVPVTSAAFLGVLVGVVARLLIPLGKQQPDVSAEEPSAPNPPVTTVLLIALWLPLLWIDSGHAQMTDPPSRAPAADTPMRPAERSSAANPASGNDRAGERENRHAPGGDTETVAAVDAVLIPLGNDGRPEPVWQIPASLYERLLQIDRRARRRPSGWIFTRGDYRSSLVRDGSKLGFGLEDVQVTIDLRVFSRGATVLLPLKRQEVQLSPESVRLDGRSIPVEPVAEGWQLKVSEPGPYQLTFVMRQRSVSSSTLLDVAIPAIPATTVQIALSEQAPELNFPTALGAIRLENNPRRAIAELGPAGRLEIQAGSDAGDAAFQYDQFSWFDVRPSAVVLRTKFVIRPNSGELTEFALALDPLWSLLPLDESSPVVEIRTTAGEASREIVLRLKEPTSEPTEVEVRLLRRTASGLGRHRLPRLSLPAGHALRRLVAVSVQPALQFSVDTSPDVAAIAAGEFAQLWGDDTDLPKSAYRLPEAAAEWVLATTVREAESTARQTVAYSVGRDAGLFRLAAEMQTDSGYRFQHRFRIPPGVEIDEVSIRQDQRVLRSRWALDAEILTVFLGESVSGPHSLSIEGHFRVPPKGPLVLRSITPLTAVLESSQVEVYRRRDVTLQIAQLRQWTRVDNVQQLDYSLGRLVGRFESDSAEGSARVQVSSNSPQIAPGSEMLTSLWRKGEQWWAEINLHLHVNEGTIDQLRLSVPPWWEGPWEMQPAGNYQLLDMPDGQHRQLLVYPHAAVAGQYRLILRAALPDARLRLPDVQLLDQPDLRRYLMLPSQDSLRQLEWVTEGLQEVEFPAGGFQPPATAERGGITYRVTGEAIRATPRPAGLSLRQPMIRLADVHVAWQANGHFLATASYALEPSELDHLEMEMPAAAQLVHVNVGGSPVLLSGGGGAPYRVPLGPKRLPQTIQVVYQGWLTSSNRSHKATLLAPRLLADEDRMNVERTLWTVTSPAHAGEGTPEAGRPLTAARQHLVRLEAISALLDLDADIASDRPLPERRAWYRPWARRMIALRDAIRRAAILQAGQSSSTATDSTATAAFEQTDNPRRQADVILAEHAEVARRLDLLETLSEVDTAERRSSTAEHWSWSQSEPRRTLRFNFPGDEPSMSIVYQQAVTGPDPTLRWLATIGLVTAVLAIAISVRKGLWNQAAWRWPHALATAVGLFWWLLLTPSVLGLVIVLLSVAASLRWSWRMPKPANGEIGRLRVVGDLPARGG